jgi:hypothetical protein
MVGDYAFAIPKRVAASSIVTFKEPWTSWLADWRRRRLCSPTPIDAWVKGNYKNGRSSHPRVHVKQDTTRAHQEATKSCI